MRKKYAYIIALLLCAAAAGVFATSNGKSDPPFPFTTVTPQELAGGGVALTQAQTSPSGAAVAQSVANAHASAALGQAAVRESHYVHCLDTNEVPAIDEDCYVVSVDASDLPVVAAPGFPDPPPMKWAVVLVDPTTGNVLVEKAGNQ